MKKILSPIYVIAGLAIFIFIMSNVFPPVMKFLSWWLLKKEEVNASITTEQALLIDAITHLVVYASVGSLFGFLNCWDKEKMHIVYIILSEAVSLFLAVGLRLIVDFYWIILIIVGLILILGIVLLSIPKKSKKKTEEKDNIKEAE